MVVGNDFAFSYERLTAAARAAAAGAHSSPPISTRACRSRTATSCPDAAPIVEAVAAAAGVRPLVVGKPEPPLFELALKRMGLTGRTRSWWATASTPTSAARAAWA